MTPSPLHAVRAACLALPGVVERPSHGEPAWFVHGRQFAMFADHHHDDRVAVWCATPPGAQESLIEAAPDRWFRPPYVGHRGWVGARLDLPDVDWAAVRAVLQDAYATVSAARPRRRAT